jgi:hypothetical protein
MDKIGSYAIFSSFCVKCSDILGVPEYVFERSSHCNKFTEKTFILASDDINVTKNPKFSEDFFDSYYVDVNSEIKASLISEMNAIVQKVLLYYDIKLPNLLIEADDFVTLTKKEVELTKEGKLKLNPYANYTYETTVINTNVIVLTGIDIKIRFTKEEIVTDKPRSILSYFL